MAFAVAILAALAMVGPLNAYHVPSTGSGQLAKDFQEVFDLIPLNEFMDISRAYQAQDAQFQTMLKFVTSPESKNFVLDVEASDAVKKLLAYVQANGLDIYYLMNKFNKALQLPPYKPLAAPKRQITGGLAGYVKDISAIMPSEDMTKIVEEKRENSKPFAGLINFILSPEFLEFFHSAVQSESYLNLMKEAEGFGVDPLDFSTFYNIFLVLVPILS